jgi:hypothetical protein
MFKKGDLEFELQKKMSTYSKEIGIPVEVTIVYDKLVKIPKRMLRINRKGGINDTLANTSQAYASLSSLPMFVPMLFPREYPYICIVDENYSDIENEINITLYHEGRHLKDNLYSEKNNAMIIVNELAEITPDQEEQSENSYRKQGFNAYICNQLLRNGELGSFINSTPTIHDYQERIFDTIVDREVDKSTALKKVGCKESKHKAIRDSTNMHVGIRSVLHPFQHLLYAMDLGMTRALLPDELYEHYRGSEKLLFCYREIVDDTADFFSKVKRPTNINFFCNQLEQLENIVGMAKATEDIWNSPGVQEKFGRFRDF